MRNCESNRRTVTEHVVYCGREEQHHGPCSFADGNGMHFWFSGYEIANLREMMLAITEASVNSPLKTFDGGDWFAQVRDKITHGFVLPHNSPNRTSEQLLADYKTRSERK